MAMGNSFIRAPHVRRVTSVATLPGWGCRRGYLAWSGIGRCGVAAYSAGLLLIVGAWALGTIVVDGLVLAVRGAVPADPVAFLAYLTALFAGGALAVPWVVRRVHRRPGWSVATGDPSGSVLRPFLVGAAVTAASLIVMDIATMPYSPLRLSDWRPVMWLWLVAVAVLGFAVQAGFEELLFRGYLMQAVASRVRRVAAVIVLPAVAFALPHWGNLAPFRDDPRQLAPYLLLGLTYGWAAWRTGSIWLPFGMHWANNVYLTVLVTPVGDIVPTGALLSRDLGWSSLEVLIAEAAILSVIQVVSVGWAIRRGLLGDGLRATCESQLPQ